MEPGAYRTVTTGVAPFFARKYSQEAAKYWEKFYKRNRANFFKDRHWTTDGDSDGFESLARAADAAKRDGKGVVVLVEAGCGAANCAFPLLDEHEALFVYMFDFAPAAIQLVRESGRYDENRAKAFVWDFSRHEKPNVHIGDTALFATLVFVLSAVPPERQENAVRALAKLLKPGGRILFRDYAEGDMAQARFAKSSTIADNYFVRQDGTLSYFFNERRLHQLMCAAGLFRVYCKRVLRTNVNRKRQIVMNRVFLQAEYERRVDEAAREQSETDEAIEGQVEQ